MQLRYIPVGCEQPAPVHRVYGLVYSRVPRVSPLAPEEGLWERDRLGCCLVSATT